MPMFAAAGAHVASFDNSPEQLRRDQEVAQAHNLTLQTFQGDMADLSCFENERFDLIFHPVSNVFAPNIEPVWKECFRVLKPGGRLLAGFMNPCFYLFDHDAIDSGGPLEVRFELPFSDVDQFSEEENRHRIEQGQALEFSHSLDDQIGGQLKAGFTLGGFYEDRWDNSATPLNQYMPTSMATLAIKPTTP